MQPMEGRSAACINRAGALAAKRRHEDSEHDEGIGWDGQDGSSAKRARPQHQQQDTQVCACRYSAMALLARPSIT